MQALSKMPAGRATAFGVGMLIAAFAWADDGKGLQIAQESARRDDGFQQFRADMEMILKDPRGKTSLRKMRLKALETAGDGDKTLVFFHEPRDVQGTAFLNYTHKQGSDDQWLYLPALKRVKRIASDNKSGPFMGSEFAYEDLGSQEVEKYSYKYLRDEKLGDQDCFVVERIPVDQKSGYSKQIVWFDKQEYRQMQIHYFDKKDELLKELKISGYKSYKDKFWKPSKMFMTNLQSGKITEVSWSDYNFDIVVSESDFQSAALDRVR